MNGVLDFLLLFIRNLVAVFAERFFGGMDQGFRLIAVLRRLAPFLVLIGMGLGILDHGIDFVVGQATRSLDANLLFLARGLVLGRDVDDAVGVDIEGDLHLGHATGRGGDSHQVELTQQLVVRRHFALALENPDGDRALIVLGGGKHLGLLGRDCGIAVDQPREHAPQGLDTEAERRDIQQQYVLDVALQHAGLNGGTDGHHLVGVDPLVGFAAEEILHPLDDLGHTGLAAHQDHLVDFRSL